MANTRANSEATQTVQAPKTPIQLRIVRFWLASVGFTAYFEMPSMGELAVA